MKDKIPEAPQICYHQVYYWNTISMVPNNDSYLPLLKEDFPSFHLKMNSENFIDPWILQCVQRTPRTPYLQHEQAGPLLSCLVHEV